METDPKADTEYSIVYIIHGDASYSYHIEGERYQADEKALADAKQVAKEAKKGEVFIFHQKPERRILWLFPRKDRQWYHYKNGQLAGTGKYSPKGGGLEKEAQLYQAKKTTAISRNMMLYFGHEIPSETKIAYHQSRPKEWFDTATFSANLTLFEPYFDLVVLSTCNNGNPLMAHALQNKAGYLVASPRNLHLSHLDSRKLTMLEENPNVSIQTVADSLASDSFNRLSAFLQTMVTVGVYDIEKVNQYLEPYAEQYQQHVESITQETLFKDNTDCAHLDAFANDPIPESGTTLYFKPPAFGVKEKQKSHSPWGCKR